MPSDEAKAKFIEVCMGMAMIAFINEIDTDRNRIKHRRTREEDWGGVRYDYRRMI